MGRKRKPQRKLQTKYLQENPCAASPAASYARPYKQQPGFEAVAPGSAPGSLNTWVIFLIPFITLSVLLVLLCRYLGLVTGIIITTTATAVVLFDTENCLSREIRSWFQVKQTHTSTARNMPRCPCCGEELVGPVIERQQQGRKAPPNHVPPVFAVQVGEQLFTFNNAPRVTNAEFEVAMEEAIEKCQRKGPEFVRDNFPRLVTSGLAAVKAQRQTSNCAGRYDNAPTFVSGPQYEAVQQLLQDWVQLRSQQNPQQQQEPEQQLQWEHMQKKLRLRQQSLLLDH